MRNGGKECEVGTAPVVALINLFWSWMGHGHELIAGEVKKDRDIVTPKGSGLSNWEGAAAA